MICQEGLSSRVGWALPSRVGSKSSFIFIINNQILFIIFFVVTYVTTKNSLHITCPFAYLYYFFDEFIWDMKNNYYDLRSFAFKLEATGGVCVHERVRARRTTSTKILQSKNFGLGIPNKTTPLDRHTKRSPSNTSAPLEDYMDQTKKGNILEIKFFVNRNLSQQRR